MPEPQLCDPLFSDPVATGADPVTASSPLRSLGLARPAWNQSPVGMAIVHLDGRLLEVNPAYCEISGFSRADLLGRPADDLAFVGLQSDLRASLMRLYDGSLDHFTFEHQLRHATGTVVWINATVSMLRAADGRTQCYLVSVTDIGELVAAREEVAEAEQARREEAERTRALLAHSSDIITVLDRDGRWISSTDAGTRILGNHVDIDPDGGLFELVHPDDTAAALHAFDEVVGGTRGPHDPVVLRIRTAHGTYRYFETVGQNLLDEESVGAIVLNSRDVTERVVAERALAQSEGRYRALAMNSSDLVTIVDLESSDFTYVSPSCERMLGFTPEELVGTSGFDLFHPDDVDLVARIATEAFTAGTTAGPVTYRARHRDGSWRWHESILTDLTGDPNVRGVVTNTRDVTDRVVGEQQMAELTARFQGILDNASDAILSLDAEQNIVMFNKAAEEMFACTAGDVIGGPLTALLPVRSRTAHHALVDSFRRDHATNRRMNRDRPELLGLRRDGTEFPAEVTISKLELANGDQLLTAIVRDVTARQEAAQALRRSRQELENVLRGATETSIIATNLTGAITLFNRGAQRMLGYTAEEMIGRIPTVLHDPAELTERADELGIAPGFDVIVNFAEHGEAETREWTYVRKDGSRLAVSLTVTAVREEDGTISGYLGVANDLTERKVAEQRFQAAFDRAPAAMAIVDLEGRYLQANDTTCSMLGIAPPELPGRNWLDFIHPDDAERVATTGLRIMLGELDSAPDEMRIVRGDGSMIWAYGDAAVVRDASGAPLYMLGFMADITARKQLEEQLEHEATHDPLTGLPNRLLFRRLAEQDAARAARQGSRVGIVYLDLDGFKHINDTYGHASGDELLVRVAERLRGSIRAGDTVARLGGDEFALLCCDPAGADEAHQIATRCIDSIAVPYRIGPHDVRIGASAGVAVHDGRGCDVNDLLERADTALYQAKARGKGRVELATSSPSQSRVR